MLFEKVLASIISDAIAAELIDKPAMAAFLFSNLGDLKTTKGKSVELEFRLDHQGATYRGRLIVINERVIVVVYKSDANNVANLDRLEVVLTRQFRATSRTQE